MMSLYKRMQADSFGHQPFMSESKTDNSNEFAKLTEHKGSEEEMKVDDDSGVEHNGQIHDLENALLFLENENKINAMNLHLNHEVCVKLNEENLKLQQDAMNINARNRELETEIFHMKDKIVEYEEALLNAQLEIQNLSEIVKELQTKNATKDGVYHVEKILDDMKKGKTHHFLIRWKGYGPKDDTWVKKSNLMCPDILKNYLLSKKIK